jgi:uridylate kinase
MVLVVKLSGRIFDDESLVLKYSQVVKRRSEKVGIVTGGGEVARRYIAVAKRGGASNTFQDLLGIYASRLNALLLISLLDNAYPRVPTNIEEFLEAWRTHQVVVSGGFQPGQSTATVAALVAEAVGASALLNAANIVLRTYSNAEGDRVCGVLASGVRRAAPCVSHCQRGGALQNPGSFEVSGGQVKVL